MVNKDRSVRVEGLGIRYLEKGKGPDILLLHGASLGSSADVWERNLPRLAGHGFRVIAFDQPGFGLSDNPKDYSVAYRRQFILKFMDALEIRKAHLVGHSQSGNMAVRLAFDHPARVAKVIVLGTGSLLPPLPEGGKKSGPAEGREGTATEPTLEDTRTLLEQTLYDRSLATPEVVEIRHRMSVGKNFQAFLERNKPAGKAAGKGEVPLWQRLDQAPVPLLLVYGKEDRGSAARRAALAKERFPHLNVHVIDGCKHLVQWDAAEQFEKLAVQFLAS
jgi:4,5:9,10-diseco-3-hydroxy-5,9,17-trioxoandrosta-1(10),2-diene-4-oate hydrolase